MTVLCFGGSGLGRLVAEVVIVILITLVMMRMLAVMRLVLTVLLLLLVGLPAAVIPPFGAATERAPVTNLDRRLL